jgi:hypothetical protein
MKLKLALVLLVTAGGVAVRVVSGAIVSAKAALTKLALVTWHGPVPLHPPPLQPRNSEPTSGIAVRVTTVPITKLAEQVVRQEIPSGLLVIMPLPLPVRITVIEKILLKRAVTAVASTTVTVQVPPPEQPPPLQPMKMELTSGVAVSVTGVSLA